LPAPETIKTVAPARDKKSVINGITMSFSGELLPHRNHA